ncbi:MAG: DMT family transporter [Lysobacterales bacterium]
MISPHSERRIELGGYALAALAAILFSAKAILAKLLYRYSIDPITLMTLRLGMAAPVFVLVAAFETWRARVRGSHLSGADWRQIALLGFLGYYVSSYLDFWGLQHIAAALERLILFLTPTLVLGLGVLIYRRPVPLRQRWALLVSYAGVLLVFVEHLRFDGGNVLFGSALVFAAALAYATYLLQSGELVARVGSLRLVSYVMLVSTLLCGIHYALVHDLATLRQPLPVLQLSLLNALMCTVAPVFLTMFAIARIGAGRSSQLSMLGPVSLLFLGHWILGERISLIQLIGTAVVLAGIGVLTSPARPIDADQVGRR